MNKLIKKEFKLDIEEGLKNLNTNIAKIIVKEEIPYLIRNNDFRENLEVVINVIKFRLNNKNLIINNCNSVVLMVFDDDLNYKCFAETVINYENEYEKENEFTEHSMLAYKNNNKDLIIKDIFNINLIKLNFTNKDFDVFKLLDNKTSVCRKIDIFCKKYNFQ